ncbi:hypothetical protein SHK09_01515 [Polaribacter sp. PL03]|uniref:hypothetical protein n=1 Tax=Polaribacter sp. PL03 TaxID=3088353 RepID=UPI0029CBA89C|nr:hypothetical protein [Polaribacter sp. PL03]MDX6745453.1 hypothetical protein [Polaribacter sp. PL03]
MKKIILSLAIVFGMSSFTSPSVEKKEVNKIALVQLSPSDCVKYARNIVLGYAAGNNMDTCSDSGDYNYLMGEYMSQYKNCLEDIGYLK